MAWPVLPHGFLGAQGSETDNYRIERSLRFNSADSATLDRAPSNSGNRTAWTQSFWIKRSKLGTEQHLFESGGANFQTFFDVNDCFRWYENGSYIAITTQVFRDTSAWYHFVLTWDSANATAGDRFRIYVNGVRVTSFSTTSNPSLNQSSGWNQASTAHYFGRYNASALYYFDGYLTEAYFIDGQALTPSSFGETDAITGRWKAKAYSGTYGTNGFYLKFADNSGTTSTTLGKDSSGNGNNWTPYNFSVDNVTNNGVGNDSLVDSPTNYGTDTGLGGEVRGNYATLNPLTGSTLSVYSDGGLQVSGSGANAGNFSSSYSTIGITSGKWYAEFTFLSGGTNNAMLGVGSHVYPRDTSNQNSIINGITSINLNALSVSDRAIIENGVQLTGGDASFSFSLNDIIGIAFDADARTINFYKNGLILGSTYPYDVASVGNGVFYFIVGTRVNSGTSSFACNFGQRPFAYTAPAGFKALCTQNLPQPTIQKPSTAMDAVLRTGAAGTGVTVTGLGFKPSFVWEKSRSIVSSHFLVDDVRGVEKYLSTNSTSSESTSSNYFTSFNSDGFTIGTNDFAVGSTIVDWCWNAGSTNSTNNSGSITSTVRANPQAGFSIVSYTGTGANATVGHGLGVAPKMVILKRRDAGSSPWMVWHSGLSGGTYYLVLSGTVGQAVGATRFTASPTSSVVNIGTDSDLNASSGTYIAYCFSEIEGYSKFGSYTGNGSSDGPFVFTGMRPRWVMIKRTDSTGSWYIIDTARGTTNVVNPYLLASASNTEASDLSWDILSNGFKLRSSYIEINNSGATYVYAAFAESPFKYSRAR